MEIYNRAPPRSDDTHVRPIASGGEAGAEAQTMEKEGEVKRGYDW